MPFLEKLASWFRTPSEHRCGVPDNLRMAAEAPSRWASTHLKWFVESRPTGVGITPVTYDVEVSEAFARWFVVCPALTFVQTLDKASANVILRVARGPDYGFTGKIGVAANAFMPTNDHFDGQLFLTLNADKTWVIKQAGSGGIIILPILVHEIGHTLGLFHSTLDNQAMSKGAYYDRPQDEDIRLIRELYGVPVPVPPPVTPVPQFIRSRVEAHNRVYEGNLPLTH